MHIHFLDDQPSRIQRIRYCDTITYVRSPTEFKDYFSTHPVPEVISFDHDLGLCSVEDVDLNGLDMIQWCVDNNYLPQVAVIHTWNIDRAYEMAKTLREVGVQVFIKAFSLIDVLFQNPATELKKE
jgi:hypothetical protein